MILAAVREAGLRLAAVAVGVGRDVARHIYGLERNAADLQYLCA
jgi:hypothetical protein